MKALSHNPFTIFAILVVLYISPGARANAQPGWLPQTSGTDQLLRSVFFINPDTGYAVGYHDRRTTTNGGQTWNEFGIPTFHGGGFTMDIVMLDKDTGIIAGSNCQAECYAWMYRTTNGGLDSWSWAEGSYSGGFQFWGVGFGDMLHGTAVGSLGTIIHTTDAGLAWANQASGTTAPLFGVGWSDAATGTVVGDSGIIFRTTDGGESWVRQESVTSTRLRRVRFKGNLGMIVGNEGTLLKSTDAGVTWSPRPPGTQAYLGDVALATESVATIVGDSGLILRSTDSGETWRRQESGTPFLLLGVYMVNESVATIVGDSGTILHTTTGGDTVPYPAPSTSGLAPLYTIAGQSDFTLEVQGAGFEPASVVAWDDSARATTYFSPVQVTAAISAADVTGEGVHTVTVTTPAPGGGTSNAQTFTVYSSDTFQVAKQWNLVSVPMKVPDGRAGTLFPAATSPAYAYRGGYVSEDTLQHGPGYWMKFDSVQNVAFMGFRADKDTINVVTGWNLVGSLAESLSVGAVSSLPVRIVTSQFFGYDGGYHPADVLVPGRGYWVKVTKGGALILSLPPPTGRRVGELLRSR